MGKDNSDDLIAKFIDGMDPGAMVNKFIIVAEGIDNDGDRASYTATQGGATSWDVMGLLLYGLVREIAALVKTAMENEEDEE